MIDNKESLIDQLTQDLRPTKVLKLPLHRALTWVPLFFIMSTVFSWLASDFRPGFSDQVMEFIRFQVELLSAILVSFITLYKSFTYFIPGEKINRIVSGLIWFFSAIFIVSFTWGFFDVSPVASDLGSRPYCKLEVVAYGTVALFILLVINRKGMLDIQIKKRLLLGLSVGLMPALIMQVACMYDPLHALLFHYSPVLVVAVIGLLLSKKMLR